MDGRTLPPDRALLVGGTRVLVKAILAGAALLAALASAPARPAQAAPGDANPDSVYLVGEFVDPVCTFQHGLLMVGRAQRECALVQGRVEQGMYFLDLRQRRLFAVIGQNHWSDPRQGFLDALGDTFAVRAKLWKRLGSAAIAVNAMYPYRTQPEVTYRWWPWRWEWSVLAGCGLLALLYLLALTVWRWPLGAVSGRFERWRAAAFLCGLVVVALSLEGPLHDLSDLYFFSTHMVQHLFLAQVFPPLFLLGLPPWLRRWLLRPPLVRHAWAFLAGVPMGFVLYTVVFSIWHVPLLYNLMMRNHDIHIVMHLLVMATATMLWWPVIGGDDAERPLAPPAQMLYLFAIGIPMMAVAAMLTFASTPLYEWYALAPRLWGFTALDDQRLGGLIMWIPGGLFWWGVMSIVFLRWASREGRAEDDPVALGIG